MTASDGAFRVVEALAWIILVSTFALLLAFVTDDLDMASNCRAGNLNGDGDYQCELVVRKPGLDVTIPMPKSPSD